MPEPQLGTTQLGTDKLSVDVIFSGLNSITAKATAEPTPQTSVSTTTTQPFSSNATVSVGSPTVLNPENLQTSYVTDKEAFVSEWFVEETPVPESVDHDVVITADLKSEKPITVVLERDDTGNGVPDAKTNTYETGHGVVTPLMIDGVEGSQYRVVFPEYSRDDDVDAVRVSLTWQHDRDIENAFPIRGVDVNSGFIGDALDTYASELYRLDARLDEEYDNRFLDTASGPILDAFGAPVEVNRRSAEQDDKLRYRISVEYAIHVSDGTIDSLEEVISRLLETPSSATVSVSSNAPELAVDIPQSELDAIQFNKSTVERKLQRAMPSGYGVAVTAV